MGKGIRHIPEGQDFTASDFASQKGFGFTGSSQGYDDKGGAAAPFAKSSPTMSPQNLDRFAKGGQVGGHPMGHQVVRVHHDPGTGAVIHHHQHGGYSVHDADGSVSHHMADGQPAMAAGQHNPGEGTFLSKMKSPAGIGGSMDMDDQGGGEPAMARGGHFGHKKPMSRPGGKMPGQQDQPSNRAPRNPMRNPSRPNDMPGGQMAYGVQPGSEPDEAGSEQDIPQMTGKGAKAPDNV